MKKLEEIEGIYLGEKRRFDEWIIGNLDQIVNDDPLRRELKTITGEASQGELEVGTTYRFFGSFSDYQNRRTGAVERQFKFRTFVPVVAHTKESVVAYLIQAGKGKGVGPATAERIWKQYGPNTTKAIRKNPRLLCEFGRVSPEDADAIGKKLDAQAKTEDATIELIGLLDGRGFPKSTARNAIKRWGNRASRVIAKNPYQLIKLNGCGFRGADALWRDLGLPRDSIKRQMMCAWYAVKSASNGDTWIAAEKAARTIREMVGGDVDPVKAVRYCVRLGRMLPKAAGALAAIRSSGVKGPIDPAGDRLWLAEIRNATAEEDLANTVAKAVAETNPERLTVWGEREVSWEEAAEAVKCRRCSRELRGVVYVWDGKPFGSTCIDYISDGTDVEEFGLDAWLHLQPPSVRSMLVSGRIDTKEIESFSLWPDPADITEITDHQREGLERALTNRIAILGGSPGTGKTYTVARLIRAILDQGLASISEIAIGCPTGKAAIRLTESLRAANLPIKAETWHGILGVAEATDGGPWRFHHGTDDPLPHKILIGDESSMIDTSLMGSILAARSSGAHVLLVGDVNQLPPVGTGAPFRDMIRSEVPSYGELSEIIRNSGGIVEACAAIRDGEQWGAGSNLEIDEVRAEQQIDRLIERITTTKGIDPIWDCQVLVAVNERSPICRKVINKRLQEELNANPESAVDPFRVGDKIVCLKNKEFLTADDEQGRPLRVANGEIGEVREIYQTMMIVSVPSAAKKIKVPAIKGQGNTKSTVPDWDLAYALSTHKSQGSEWPIVFVMLDEYPGARMVCDRSWIYTAISRARSRCILIGIKATADAMCRRTKTNDRKTFLRERIQLFDSERVLESL